MSNPTNTINPVATVPTTNNIKGGTHMKVKFVLVETDRELGMPVAMETFNTLEEAEEEMNYMRLYDDLNSTSDYEIFVKECKKHWKLVKLYSVIPKEKLLKRIHVAPFHTTDPRAYEDPEYICYRGDNYYTRPVHTLKRV